ncbi:MAG: MaoC family dehydratase [Mesorhizobium sp.]
MEDATQKPARIGLAELDGLVGRQLGSSRWHRISQQEIDKFAEATGDFQPIHVDPEAARKGPYGKTIAHGFLTLSLVASLTPEAFGITDAQSLINYGVNRVRFPAPLLEGERVMLTTSLVAVESRPAGKLLTLSFEIHPEGGSRPVAIGETLLLAVAQED